MNVSSRLLMGALALALISCTEAEPESTLKGGLFSPPTFFGGHHSLELKTKDNNHFMTVRGECPLMFSDIQISLDGGESWQEPFHHPGQSPGQQFNCADGTFLFYIHPESNLGLAAVSAFDLLVRANSFLGPSPPASLRINFDEMGPVADFQSPSGVVTQGADNYQVTVLLDSIAAYEFSVEYSIRVVINPLDVGLPEYDNIPGSFMIMPGENSGVLNLGIIDKPEYIDDIGIEIELGDNAFYSVGATEIHELTILDNLPPPQDDTVMQNLSFESVTTDSFIVYAHYMGDANDNATAEMFICNATRYPGCDPLGETATSMTKGMGMYFESATGLLQYPDFAGDLFNVTVVASDPDGVTGSPLSEPVQLLPYLDVQQLAGLEGDSFEFLVTLNASVGHDVTFDWVTSDDTAEGGTHYTSGSGTVTIPSGQTQILLPPIVTANDAEPNNTRIFRMNISSPAGADIRTSSAKGFIMDNDPGLISKGFNGVVNSIAVSDDGSFKIVGGNFSSYSTNKTRSASKINPDGSKSITFYTGSGFTGGLGQVYAWVQQSDGKYLVGGDFTQYNGEPVPRLVRLNADGSLDESFNSGGSGVGGFTDGDRRVGSIVLQQDGKILVVGNFSTYNGISRWRIARLNEDGTLDTEFNPGGGAVGNPVFSMLLLRDRKVLLGGMFDTFDGISRSGVARLNHNGSLDTTFDPGSGVAGTGSPTVRAMVETSDGSIYLGGVFNSYDGVTRNGIARIFSGGSIDTDFDPGSGFNLNMVYSLAELNGTGQVYAAGGFTLYNELTVNPLIRLNPDGSRDNTFNVEVMGSHVRSIVPAHGGDFLIGGKFTQINSEGRNGLAKINSSGDLVSFDVGSGILDVLKSRTMFGVHSITTTPKGDILIGGLFDDYQAIPVSRVARFDSAGGLDETFAESTVAQGGFNASGSILAIAIQEDNRILLGGTFSQYNGVSRARILRLNVNGILDEIFNPGGGASGPIEAIALQDDGRIIIGGWFTSYNATVRNHLARILSDGSLDTTFDPGSGPNSVVHAIAIQPDGRIVIGGNFASYNGTGRNRFARVEPDGNLDTGFGLGTAASNTIFTLGLQPDGKILAGGLFTSFNGISSNRIVRTEPNGTLDSTFDIGSGFTDGMVNSISLQADGKVVVGGSFSSYNGNSANRIVRISSDGIFDPTFDTGTGVNLGEINTTTGSPNGDIYIGGIFSSFDGVPVSSFHRLGPPDSISLGNLIVDDVTNSSFAVHVGYYGDANQNSTASLHYCNETANPGCDPETGPGQASMPMTALAGVANGYYSVLIDSGLLADNTYNLRVIATDPDGVEGSPVDSTVTLLAP